MTTFSPPSGRIETPESLQSTKPLPNPSRRREKPQLSCILCRRRKLKCDRGQPCETCVRRGLSLSCTYVHSHTPVRLNRSPIRPAASASMQDRIGQLERLVVSLMGTLNEAKPTSETSAEIHASLKPLPLVTEPEVDGGTLPEDPSHLSDSFGRISLENAEISYVEGAHWTAILDGIAELKNYFEDDHGSVDGRTPASKISDSDGPELLFGHHKSVGKQEILAAIPPRPVVDRLVAKCFNSLDTASVGVHIPTFLKEYEQFWVHPLDTPVMWIGLLFAIMGVALLYQQSSPNESGQPLHLEPASDTGRLIQTYREKTIQCLVLGKYTKAVPYTIETLLLYMYLEFLGSPDTQIGNWILLGIIVRLALRTGYHRDASHFPRISPFQAEMRRRVWALITHIDAIGSAQVGLPRMVRESQSDTAEPRNLLDDDLDENMVELPAPRPDTVQTPILYFVAKNRLIAVFGMISDMTTSIRQSPYAEVLRLDKILHDAYKKVPDWLQMRPMTQSVMDSPEVIVRRMYVALAFYKAKCVLHRKYLLSARTDIRYIYSRTTCIQSALQILQCQWVLDQETQAGGRLDQDRSKVSSIVRQDFLLATTLLCLDLDYGITAELSSERQKDTSDTEKVIKALNESYLIWLRSSASSREAQKAAEVLRIVLGKARKMGTRGLAELVTITPGATGDSTPLSTGPSSLVERNQTPQSSSAGVSIGAPPSSMDLSPLDAGTLTMFSEIGAEPLDFDNWDSGYQTQSMDDMLEMSEDFPGMFEIPM